MPISLACKCGKSFRVKDEHAGKKTKCPACAHVLVIPARDNAAPPDAALTTGAKPFRCAECGSLIFMASDVVKDGGQIFCKTCFLQRPSELPMRNHRKLILFGGIGPAALCAVGLMLYFVLRDEATPQKPGSDLAAAKKAALSPFATPVGAVNKEPAVAPSAPLTEEKKDLSVVPSKAKEPPPEKPKITVAATQAVLADDAQLKLAEKPNEQTATSLIRAQLGSELYQYGLFNTLREMRPLPEAAVPLLHDCLKSSNSLPRGWAAQLLAYHQKRGAETLKLLRSARDQTREPQPKKQLDQAIAHLEAVGKETPVLADSAQFWQLVDGALDKVPFTPGRETKRSVISGSEYSEIYRAALPKQMPETLVLLLPDHECPVVLGWPWQVYEKDRYGKRRVQTPPIGALVRLQGPLILAKSKLASGAILKHTSRGWSLLSEDEAVAHLDALLSVSDPLEMGDFGAQSDIFAAMSAAALGPPAGKLIPKLHAASKARPRYAGITGMYCSIAFVRIGDKSALPLMDELRAIPAGGNDQASMSIRDEIDRAIAALKKQRVSRPRDTFY